MKTLDGKYSLINCWVIFALLLLLVTPESRANAWSKTTIAGDSFTVGMRDEPAGLDPALDMDTASLLVTNQIYDTLVRYTPGGSTLVPGLAENWSVSANGLVWTFYLRTGVTFQDGTPLDADAVLINFNRWWDINNPYHIGSFGYFSSLFGGFKGDPSCLITSMGTNDNEQFFINLSRPDYTLPSILTNPSLAIASPAAIQGGLLSTHPVGSGPFRFIEWTAGDHIRLEAYPAYWGGWPSLESLTFKIMLTDPDRLVAIQNNSIQVAMDLPDEYAPIVSADPNLHVYYRPSSVIGYLGINRAKTPLNNLMVRKAIAYAIRRPQLLDNHYGPGYQVADQFLPPAIWGYTPSAVDYNYNLSQARSLLDQAGYSNGFEISLSYRDVIRPYLPDPSGTAAAIQADLSAVGINVTIVSMESGYFLDEYQNGNLELFLLGWGADILHPDNFFTPHFCNPENQGFGPQDTILCNFLDAARDTPEFADQKLLYEDASIYLMDNLPVLPLAYYTPLLVTRQNVSELALSPMTALDWYGQASLNIFSIYLPAVRK